jgi:hypothetical protein
MSQAKSCQRERPSGHANVSSAQLRKIQNGEFTMKPQRNGIAVSRSFFGPRPAGAEMSFPELRYAGEVPNRAIGQATRFDSAKAGSGGLVPPRIPRILRRGTKAQIFPAIIQSVSVPVIDKRSIGRLKNKPMHLDSAPLDGREGADKRRAPIVGPPGMSEKPGKIGVIDQCNVSLRQDYLSHDRHPREDWWRFVSPRHLSCVGSGTVIDHCRCLGNLVSDVSTKIEANARFAGAIEAVWHRDIRHPEEAAGVANRASRRDDFNPNVIVGAGVTVR